MLATHPAKRLPYTTFSYTNTRYKKAPDRNYQLCNELHTHLREEASSQVGCVNLLFEYQRCGLVHDHVERAHQVRKSVQGAFLLTEYRLLATLREFY